MDAQDAVVHVHLGSGLPGSILAWCRASNLLAFELRTSDTLSDALTICVLDPSVPEVGFPLARACLNAY